ncbi:MAG: GTPase HflX [Chlamydiae bacterium]|nr:GTPase HflX [Chlamydiota bacterium]
MEKEKKLTEKALLVGFYAHGTDKPTCSEHLEELKQLAQTYGISETTAIPCFLKTIHAATYMGSGKLEELSDYVKSNDYDLVIIDEEISPAQQRNLEKAFQKPVMERSEIILAVFAQRAQTREAKLQIELAQAKYQLPRLKRLWTHLSRQKGGAVNQKGEGEKQLEIDRRLLEKLIQKLERELKVVQRQRMTQRAKRLKKGIPTFAIIGYTNAGKSTLLKALTEAKVLVEDKLFATLDTTTKKFTLPNNQKILLVDTVGFIRKLPHTLIAAFKSTLEESLYADILLHVIDVSNPMAIEQAKATEEVLKELKAGKKPMVTLLNKVDQCENRTVMNRFRLQYNNTVEISALKQDGFERLFKQMMDSLKQLTKTLTLLIPQKDFRFFSDILRDGVVLEQEYQDNDIFVRASCPYDLASRLQKFEVEI